MKLLFTDFETQGEDAATTNPTEVGALLMEIPHPDVFKFPDTAMAKQWAETGPREMGRLSSLIYHVDYPAQTQEIVDLTGITDEMLVQGGIPPMEAFQRLQALMAQADVILAHNAAFDQGVFVGTCKRLGIDSFTVPWLCTVQDVPWAKKYKCKKLSHLAFDHGILADASKLHRADYDCELLSQLILGKYNFQEILQYWKTPWVCIFLNGVQKPWEDGGVTNAQAKKLGFSWERPWGTDLVFPKRWVKRVKETRLSEEKEKCPAHFSLTRATPETVAPMV